MPPLPGEVDGDRHRPCELSERVALLDGHVTGPCIRRERDQQSLTVSRVIFRAVSRVIFRGPPSGNASFASAIRAKASAGPLMLTISPSGNPSRRCVSRHRRDRSKRHRRGDASSPPAPARRGLEPLHGANILSRSAKPT